MSKKVSNNIDSGLWIETANGTIVSVSEPEYGDYLMTFHAGRMPAHSSKSFTNLEALEAAMREVAPVRNWRTKMED